MLLPEMARKGESRSPTPLPEVEQKPEPIVVENDSGNLLHGLLFSTPDDVGTVMVSGGNAMSRNQTLHYYRFLLDQGFRLLVFSFQGYDENEGDATLDSLVGDAAAFLKALKARYPDEKVAYAGSSISTAAALCLPARSKDVAALVVEGALDPGSIPYSKLKQLWYFLPLYPILVPAVVVVSATVPDAVRVDECIASYSSVPILFVHHPYDIATPFDSAFDIFHQYGGPKRFLIARRSKPPAYHNSYWEDELLRDSAVEFLRDFLGAREEVHQ